MRIYRYSECDRIGDGCVIALGFFDGVHLGHRELLRSARERAEAMKLPLGVFTFTTDSPIKKGKKIYSDSERCALLREAGADFALICSFGEVSELSPEDFVLKVLIGKLSARVAVAGFNYRFGKGASGDAAALTHLMERAGGCALICEDVTLDGETVSTTRIKARLEAGEVAEAARLLGAPFRISGEVTHGNSVGRKLGFPTVNTSRDEWLLLPRRGVYRTATVIDGKVFSALTNVGSCPTFGDRDVHCETYILDFDGDLYGRNITVYFLDYLREEIRFESEKELIMQINIDKSRIIKENGDAKWQELGLNLQ